MKTYPTPLDKPVRVSEIALYTGTKSINVIADLRMLGFTVKSASSKIEPVLAATYIKRIDSLKTYLINAIEF